MNKYFKYLLYLYVFIGLNLANAGSYDDFFKAIELDQPEVVHGLLARGFDPNSPSSRGVPALLLAYQKKSMKVLDVMLASKQTNLNVLNSSGENLLMLAAIDNQLALAEKLIEKGADINKPGWTALHYASSKDHIDMVRLLLEHQAYIDAESPNGTTPLMMAARYGTAKTVKLLLEEGADPRIRNQLGYDALRMAHFQTSIDSASYVQSFLDMWNQRYDIAPPAQVADNNEEEEPVEVTANPTLAQPEVDEPLNEVKTGAPLSATAFIETKQIEPEGIAETIEIRPAVDTDLTTATTAPSIQISPIDVTKEAEKVPYVRQIRSRAVVTVEVMEDPLQTQNDDQ